MYIYFGFIVTSICVCWVYVQASTMALQEIPAVNGMIDDATKEIVYRNYVDVSVAVASPNGLVVPVLRNTENMSFAVSSPFNFINLIH